MMLTDLADVVRRSGLRVVEISGWRTRGQGELESVESITCHHTGTPNSLSGDYPTMGTIVSGRPGLRGTLAQLGLGRSGTVYVIAAGLCWHAGVTFYPWQNNAHAIGIEAEHPGGSTPWPADQYAAYVRLVRALRDGYDVPNARVLGHKEVAKPLGRKSDPTFSMDSFRAAVARLNPDSEGELDMADAASIEKKIDSLAYVLGLRYDVDADRYVVETNRWNAEIERDQADAARDAEQMGVLGQLAVHLAAVRGEVKALSDRLFPEQS
jgi:hypothetical protein